MQEGLEGELFDQGMLAEQLGLDGALARRCGFLHDLGKAADHEMEGGHPAVGAELLKRYGEGPEVVHAALRDDGVATYVIGIPGSAPFTALLAKEASPADINAAMKKAAEGPLKGILRYTEKELVLDVTLRLGELLKSRLGTDVVYTRDADNYVGLEERTNIANERKADLFLSIHANSSRSDKPFVTVSTGNLQPDLLESALFGHVTGAFTGAVYPKKGLFDLADKGTIFFDEVGTIGSA